MAHMIGLGFVETHYITLSTWCVFSISWCVYIGFRTNVGECIHRASNLRDHKKTMRDI